MSDVRFAWSGFLELAITLRIAREHAGLTQQQVADAMGLNVEIYGNIECAQMMPSIEMLRSICAILRLDYAAVLALVDRGDSTLMC